MTVISLTCTQSHFKHLFSFYFPSSPGSGLRFRITISFLLRSIFYPRHSMNPLGKAKGPESPQDLPCIFTQGLNLLKPFVGILFSSQDGSIPCTEYSGQWNVVLRGLDCFPRAPVGGTKSRIGLSPNPLLWLTVESWCYVCKVQIREV